MYREGTCGSLSATSAVMDGDVQTPQPLNMCCARDSDPIQIDSSLISRSVNVKSWYI